MKPGPAPAPTKLKLLRGNPRGENLNRDEPEPTPGKPDKPEGLHPIASAAWDRIVDELDRLGMLTKIDRDALKVYCEAVATHDLAVELVRQAGVLVRRGGRENGEAVKNPALQIVRDQAHIIRSFGAAFGLTPSDRSRLTVPMSDPHADLERILNA
jgi:P27 family predicted phage terminase small subunit